MRGKYQHYCEKELRKKNKEQQWQDHKQKMSDEGNGSLMEKR